MAKAGELVGFFLVSFLAGQGARDGAREVVAEFAHGDGEAVDDDAADGEEPDDDVHDVLEVGGVGADGVVFEGDGVEEVEGDVEVEDCGDADGAEETHECGLVDFFDLGDLLVNRHHEGDAAEEEDQDA